MITIKDLKKRFQSLAVLNGISLEINKGEVIGIIGPSGTGKSTLLRCINYLEKPDEGSISFDGVTYNYKSLKSRDAVELRKKTGMVFQQFNLFQRKTVLENVMEGLTVVQKLPKKEAEEIAKAQLAKVKMDDRLRYYPRHLSGGQQQRVAIARALALKPQLLLLDEPTSALDPELVGEVLETIRTIAAEGNTMLLVSHEMEFIRNVSDRVIFMENGVIVEEGAPDKVFLHPDNPRTKEFLVRNRAMTGKLE